MAAALAWIAYRAAQRAIVLDVTHLLWLEPGAVRELPPVDSQWSFRFLSADEVAGHALDPANSLSLGLAHRLRAQHDLCFAALTGEVLAAYIWLALGSIEAEQHRGRRPDPGLALSFPPDVAFVYHAFTRADYRGRRLVPHCLARALAELAPLGVGQLFSTTDWTNTAALRSFRRLGFHDLGRVWRWGLPSQIYTHVPRAAGERGVLFEPQAIIQPRPPAWHGSVEIA